MMIEFIKDVSVVIGLWVVFYNIAAWHLQHREKRKIDLVEETLALFYEAKDAIAFMRLPLGFENETDSVKEEDGESKEEFEARKKASVIFVRYNRNKEVFSKIHSLRYRFMAQIGKDKIGPFDNLDQIIKEIVASARLLAILWSEKYFETDEDKKRHREEIKKAERVFCNISLEGDPINPKIDKVISDIEEVCKSVIMAKGTLHGFLNWPIKIGNKIWEYLRFWKDRNIPSFQKEEDIMVRGNLRKKISNHELRLSEEHPLSSQIFVRITSSLLIIIVGYISGKIGAENWASNNIPSKIETQVVPEKTSFPLSYKEKSLPPAYKKESLPSSDVTIVNKGILPANTTYSVVSSDSTITDTKVEVGGQYIQFLPSTNPKIKVFDIKNLPKDQPIKVSIIGSDSVTLKEGDWTRVNIPEDSNAK